MGCSDDTSANQWDGVRYMVHLHSATSCILQLHLADINMDNTIICDQLDIPMGHTGHQATPNIDELVWNTKAVGLTGRKVVGLTGRFGVQWELQDATGPALLQPELQGACPALLQPGQEEVQGEVQVHKCTKGVVPALGDQELVSISPRELSERLQRYSKEEVVRIKAKRKKLMHRVSSEKYRSRLKTRLCELEKSNAKLEMEVSRLQLEVTRLMRERDIYKAQSDLTGSCVDVISSPSNAPGISF